MTKHHVECAYCGVEQECEDDCRALTPETGSDNPTAHKLGPIPPADDDAAWAGLAAQHSAECEWLVTRSHRL